MTEAAAKAKVGGDRGVYSGNSSASLAEGDVGAAGEGRGWRCACGPVCLAGRGSESVECLQFRGCRWVGGGGRAVEGERGGRA